MVERRPFKIPCRCGTKTMNFKKNIGPFYIDECCRLAGYNHLGLKEGEKPATPVAPEVGPKVDAPSDLLDKRKAEKAALQESRASEIAARQAERDAREAEKAKRSKKLAEGKKQDGSSS